MMTWDIPTFTDLYRNELEPGTLEWEKQRQTRFGGSDLGSLLNRNKYKSTFLFLSEKVGLAQSDFSKSEYFFLWGHFFEPVHRPILEDYFNTDIVVPRSIPWHPTNKHASSYADIVTRPSIFHVSPDGIAQISRAAINKYLSPAEQRRVLSAGADADADVDRNYSVVFEQKAPAMRIPDGDIPAYYKPQVYSGMNVVPFSDFAIYTEAIFKRCSIQNMGDGTNTITDTRFFVSREWNAYETDVGRLKYRDDPAPKPMACGIVLICCNALTHPEVVSDYYDLFKFLNARNGNAEEYVPEIDDFLIDFGKVSSSLFFRMVKDWRAGKFSTIYVNSPRWQDIDDAVAQHITANDVIVGCVPWKLFDMTLHFLPNNREYVDLCWPALTVAKNLITECNNLTQEYKKDIVLKASEEIIRLAQKVPA